MNDNWGKVRLKDIAELNPYKIDKNLKFETIEYLDITSVGTGCIKKPKKIKINIAPSRAKRLVKDENIILSTVRPNRRSFYYFKNAKENLVVSTGFAVLQAKKRVLPRLLYYLINDYKFTEYLTRNTKGSAYPAIDEEILSNATMYIPKDLKYQNKIISILSAYDELIENNNRRIEILEEIAETIYKEWFVHFQFPGYEKVKMVDSEIGKIPEGWRIYKISEKFTTVLGGTPSRNKPEYWNGNIQWVNSGKVNELRIIDESEFITELGLKESSTKIMPKRTTVVAITGATLGQVSLLEIETCANQSVVGIYDQEHFYDEYIYLKMCEIIKGIIVKSSGGAHQHINKNIINSEKILVPSIEIVDKFNKYIRPIFDLIRSLLIKNEHLKNTRDLLLPKLISGTIDVSDLDIKTEEIK